MAKKILRKMLSLFVSALRIYLILVVVIWFVQDYLLYRPPTYTTGEAMVMADTLNLAPYVSPSATSWENVAYTRRAAKNSVIAPHPRGTIIVVHGNGSSALYSTDFSDALTPLGFRVILYEYPGYGSNPGSPSEESCVKPLQQLVREVASEKAPGGNGARERVYLFGQSLGCGVVSSALKDKTLPVAGVILLQPWDTLAGVAGTHYPFLPVSLMVGAKYDSMANLPNFSGPVAFVTCEKDRTIPPRLSQRLYDAYPGPKTWLQHPDCDHNTWPSEPDLLWWKTVTDFVAPPYAPSRAAATPSSSADPVTPAPVLPTSPSGRLTVP